MRSIQGCTMILIRSEQSGRFLLSRRAHLLTTSSKQAPYRSLPSKAESSFTPLLLLSPQSFQLCGVPFRRWYFLRKPCALRGRCGFCGSLMDNATLLRNCCHCPRRRLYVLLFYQNSCSHFGNSSPPASEKHQPDVFHCYGYRFFCDTHFLFAKKKQKQKREDGENEWQSTTWKQKL